jgi:hypothetical protein
MKTPRELLLERHRRMQSRLDAVTDEVLANFPGREQEDRGISWREMLLSLRWHIPALGGAWMLIFFLNSDRHSSAAPLMAGANTPSPVQVLASLHEQRRQLQEWTADASAIFVPQGPVILPPRRSELQSTNNTHLA